MRFIAVLVAFAHVVLVSGCSQVVQIQRDDIAQHDELKNVTIRTKSGDIYYFENAAVFSDSLRGEAQETQRIYLEGGEVSERTLSHDVRVALTDVEQLTVRKRSWGKTGLLVLGALAVVGGIVFVTSQNNNDEPSGGDGSGGKPPLPPVGPSP